LRLLYRGTLLRLDAAELDRIRRQALPRGARRNEVRGAGFDGVFDALWAQAREHKVRNLPEKPDFEADIADRADFRDFLRAWWPRLTPMRVLRWLAMPARLRAYANGVLSREEIATLQGSFDELAEHGPTIADVALLDELDELMGRPRQPARKARNPFHVRDGVQEVSTFADRQAATRVIPPRDDDYRDYAHVVVDEAQDVSPMQWRMIGRRGAYASWTVVGDPAQSAWAGDPAELDRARDRALSSRRRNTYRLSTNYRNSAEIFAVAASVIRTIMPDLPLPRAVRSTGVDPVDLVTDAASLPSAVLEAAEKQLADVEGTVGVITPVPRRDEVAAWLSGVPGDRLQVVTALEAKGMEYDAVVLVEPGELTKDAAGVRTLYVALSRATQRLTTVGTDPGWRP
jgi:superfamily I DNA/RNA helicase